MSAAAHNVPTPTLPAEKEPGVGTHPSSLEDLDFELTCRCHRYNRSTECGRRAAFLQIKRCDHQSPLCADCLTFLQVSPNSFGCLLCGTVWKSFGAATRQVLLI